MRAASFPANELEVCGRIHGSTPNSLVAFDVAGEPSLSDVYVDGLSLTHGPSDSESHIWTFAIGTGFGSFQCQCAGGPASPSFVGEDYFCETSVTNNILWEGEDCVTELCCTCLSQPYFHAYLDSPTSDDIDARLISVSPLALIIVTDIELYVRLVPPGPP